MNGAGLWFCGNFKGVLDSLNVVGIADAQDVPAVARKRARRLREASLVLPRCDVIVVENPTKLSEARWPARERLSEEMPSIMQPSPTQAKML